MNRRTVLKLGTLALPGLMMASRRGYAQGSKKKISYAYLLDPAYDAVVWAINNGKVKSDLIEIEARSLAIPQLLQATAQAGGRTVLIGRAWRIAAASADFPAGAAEPAPAAGEPTAQAFTFPEGWHAGGYLSAIDWCFADGGFAQDGPARAWARPRVALVDGEAMTPWQRVLTVGDSGSGISACAPPAQHPAINCDFTVVLHRDPAGPWIGMDSRTLVTPGAGAMTQTTVFDAAGTAGLATQTLVA